MRRTFVALNLALAAVATLLIVYIARQFIAPMPLPVGGRPWARRGAGASVPGQTGARPGRRCRRRRGRAGRPRCRACSRRGPPRRSHPRSPGRRHSRVSRRSCRGSRPWSASPASRRSAPHRSFQAGARSHRTCCAVCHPAWAMRRNNNVSGFIASAVLLSLVAGCATRTPTPKIATPPIGPLPPPTVTVQTELTTPLPPLSVGPRAAEPGRPEAAPATPPRPAMQLRVPSAPTTSPSGRYLVPNFENADIGTVLHAASEIVGFNYRLSPDVRGKVPVQTSGRIPQEDVFGVLLGILEVHGFTAVKSGNLYKIVRVEGARERAVPTVVGDVPMEGRAGDEIITQIVPVRYASVNDLGVLLRPFVSSRGTLVANRETNVLIITDAASNIRRVLDIIKLVDVQVSLDELQIIPISFADAGEVAPIVTESCGGGRLRGAGVPGVPTAPVPGAPGAPGATAADRPPLVIAEKRSNSIIVHGRKNEIEMIRRILAQLDINVTGGRRVFIYFAENAKAKDLAATLNAIYGAKETVPTAQPSPPLTPRAAGQPYQPPPPPPTAAPGAPLGAPGVTDVGFAEGQFRFIADETTNAVIVTTTPRQWAENEATVRSLDKMPRQVLIEVLVAEITLNEDSRLGIDWALRSPQGSHPPL